MQTSTRIQTAFRLDRNLVSRLKLKARRENKSLNKLVEEALMKTAPAELEWPKVEFPLKPSPLVAVAWQYSSKGNVAGIKTRCDLDVDYDGVVRLIAQEPLRKSVDEIAREVIDGQWSNGAQRRELLREAGYNPQTVQKRVNEILKESNN